MANGETDVQALARVLTHAVSIVNRLTEESDRMMELLRQAEAQQGTREAHLARTEQAAQAALKTAQTSAEEITSRQQVLEKAVDGLPDRLSRGIKDKAHEISRAATQVISVSAEAATSMQAERKQLRPLGGEQPLDQGADVARSRDAADADALAGLDDLLRHQTDQWKKHDRDRAARSAAARSTAPDRTAQVKPKDGKRVEAAAKKVARKKTQTTTRDQGR